MASGVLHRKTPRRNRTHTRLPGALPRKLFMKKTFRKTAGFAAMLIAVISFFIMSGCPTPEELEIPAEYQNTTWSYSGNTITFGITTVTFTGYVAGVYSVVDISNTSSPLSNWTAIDLKLDGGTIGTTVKVCNYALRVYFGGQYFAQKKE
jgi:ABC-type Fe3+ transport system permease subunit